MGVCVAYVTFLGDNVHIVFVRHIYDSYTVLVRAEANLQNHFQTIYNKTGLIIMMLSFTIQEKII